MTTASTPSTTTPSLLDALLRLEQHADGRRVARKALRAAVDKIEAHLVKTLRVGDSVTVAGRRYSVVRQSSNVGSADYVQVEVRGCGVCEEPCDHAVDWIGRGYLESDLPTYLHGDFHSVLYSVTDEERIAFATHAAEILAAFAAELKANREQMTAATESAQTSRI